MGRDFFVPARTLIAVKLLNCSCNYSYFDELLVCHQQWSEMASMVYIVENNTVTWFIYYGPFRGL